ncbi:MAG: mechanosensitive ion channel, partial [Patescibacteria group bacterium]|nr:mechanosensitive ion channel [Patescibacteria group bacterium]
SEFVVKNNDKKVKKFTDVSINYNKFILKNNAQVELYDYLLKNIDKLNSKDIVLDTFQIFSLSEYINNKSRDINLYFEINVLKYFSETEVILNPAKIVLILFTIFFGIFVFKIVSFLLEKGFVKISSFFTDKNTDSKVFSHNLIDSIDKPFKWFYSTIVLFILFKILFSPNDLSDDIDTLFDLSHLFTFVWVAWRLISNYEDKITEEIKRKKDDITTEAVSFGVLTFKIFLSIVFIGAFITLAIPSIVNYFAGAGFLIAFILKDNVSDYFDAFKIIKEPNVQVGHWILLPLLKGLEGVVHKIGIWNTTIIMFDQSTITIPNSSLVKTIIRNFSRRMVRQIKFNFYLPLKLDSETILKIVNDVNKMLMDHPNLTHKEDVKGKPKDIRERGISGTCFARWVSSENGVKILVYTNTNKDDWMFQLETQEDMQAQIKNICRKYGTDMVMKDDFIDISKIEAYKSIMDTKINKEN